MILIFFLVKAIILRQYSEFNEYRKLSYKKIKNIAGTLNKDHILNSYVKSIQFMQKSFLAYLLMGGCIFILGKIFQTKSEEGIAFDKLPNPIRKLFGF